MHFDYCLKGEYMFSGKEFDNLFGNMKEDSNLEMKHKECLEYYKGDELIKYKIRIEPLIIHILNSTKFKEDNTEKYIPNQYTHNHNYKDLDDNVEKVPNFIYF